MASKYFKAGAKVFEYLKPKPKVSKTKLDKKKSELAIAIQKTKGSKAKLNQTLFEIKNKQPLTFKSQSGIKTKSNTELKKEKKVEKEKKFKKTMDDNKKAITRIFNAPKNFNKGGRAGKMGGGMMGPRMGYMDGSKKGKVPTTSKEKSLAKLAPPKDRITFGDVVAGRTKGAKNGKTMS